MELPELDPRRSLLEQDLASIDDLDAVGDAGPQVARALNTPVRRLGTAELYLLLRFNLALPAVVPLVLARLEDAPMLQAAEYPADLLTVLLESDARYWLEHRDAWESALPIIANAMELAQTTDDEGEITYSIGDGLGAAILHFMGHHKA